MANPTQDLLNKGGTKIGGSLPLPPPTSRLINPIHGRVGQTPLVSPIFQTPTTPPPGNTFQDINPFQHGQGGGGGGHHGGNQSPIFQTPTTPPPGNTFQDINPFQNLPSNPQANPYNQAIYAINIQKPGFAGGVYTSTGQFFPTTNPSTLLGFAPGQYVPADEKNRFYIIGKNQQGTSTREGVIVTEQPQRFSDTGISKAPGVTTTTTTYPVATNPLKKTGNILYDIDNAIENYASMLQSKEYVSNLLGRQRQDLKQTALNFIVGGGVNLYETGKGFITLPFRTYDFINDISTNPSQLKNIIPAVLNLGETQKLNLFDSPSSVLGSVAATASLYAGVKYLPRVFEAVEHKFNYPKYENNFLLKNLDIKEVNGAIQIDSSAALEIKKTGLLGNKNYIASAEALTNFYSKDGKLFEAYSIGGGLVKPIRGLELLRAKEIVGTGKKFFFRGVEEGKLTRVPLTLDVTPGIKTTQLVKGSESISTLQVGTDVKALQHFLFMNRAAELTDDLLLSGSKGRQFIIKGNKISFPGYGDINVAGLSEIKPLGGKPVSFTPTFENFFANFDIPTLTPGPSRLIADYYKALSEQVLKQAAASAIPATAKASPVLPFISTAAILNEALKPSQSLFYGTGQYEKTQEVQAQAALRNLFLGRQRGIQDSLLRDIQRQSSNLMQEESLIQPQQLLNLQSPQSGQQLKQIQSPGQQTDQLLKQISQTITGQTALFAPPGIPIVLLPFDLSGRASRTRKRRPGYSVFLKRRRQFYPIGVNLPKGRALFAGQTAALRTLGRTFKIKESGFTSEPDINFYPSERLFRSYQVKRGKALPLINTFIQRRGKSLFTQSERLELTLSRQKKALKKMGFAY